MIQDIFPHKLDNQYDPDAKPTMDSYVLCVHEGSVLVKQGEKLTFPRVSDVGMEHVFTFLFRLDEEQFYLYGDKELPKMTEEYVFVNARTLRNEGGMEKHMIYAMVTGKHLADWYKDMQFCGRCGARMEHAKTERAMKCTCGYRAYPRIMPAVIVGVTNGDKIVLTKYKNGVDYNALIAGFTEIGETVEETVRREVKEEVGLEVKNIRYYKSQPWGVANDILMGFYCEVDGDTTIHMDQNELKYAEWVERENIILQPNEFSLTNEMMKMFKEGKQ